LGVLTADVFAKLIQGGPEVVFVRWAAPANVLEAISGYVGGLLGFAMGYWLWKRVMVRTGVLSPAQLRELYKSE